MLSQRHKLRSLVCIGNGGHARSVSGFIQNSGYYIEKFIDHVTVMDCPLSSIENIFASRFDKKNLLFGIFVGNNFKRSKIYNILKKCGIDDNQFPNFISADAVLAQNVDLGIGNVIFPGSVINSETKICNFTILNTKSSVDHDCIINNFTSIAPGVVLGGNVSVGSYSELGIGSVIRNNLTIGDNCVLGGQAYLVRNMPSNVMYYGVPAKKIRDLDSTQIKNIF